MIRLSLVRRLITEVPKWRCPHLVRPPGCSANAQPRIDPGVSASTSRRPGVWPTSRLCHGDSRGAPQRADSTGGLTLRALTQAPKPALFVGFSGLVPFVSAPLWMAATQSFYPELAFAQVAYGASIVSFLGGARWGFAIPAGSPAQPDWMNLGNSVVPPLLAWLALLCGDHAAGATVVIVGLGLSLHYDLNLLPGYPSWFKSMRIVLTLVAIVSLVATLTIKQFCSEKNIKDLLAHLSS